MTLDWTIYACFGIGLSSALVAGTFQAFSDFVMRALFMAKPQGGIESMQLLNRTVYRSVFLIMLLGLAPLTLGFATYAYFSVNGPALYWIFGGTGIYCVFTFLVTMFGNVPMNNRLDGMDHLSSETAAYWKVYGVGWTHWNHVRMFAALITAICFLQAGLVLAIS